LKLTIQKFFRVSGGSTQLEGVRSDIRLPSLWDQADIGENALKGPLPYTTIREAVYEKVDKDLFKDELKRRSSARIGADQEFRWVMEDIERSKKRIAENKISLNEKARRTELDEDKARKEKRDQERSKLKVPADKVFSVTLDNVEKPELEPKEDKEKEKDKKANEAKASPDAKPADKPKAVDPDDDDDSDDAPKIDPIRAETVHILRDLVDFSRNGVPATAATQPKHAEPAR